MATGLKISPRRTLTNLYSYYLAAGCDATIIEVLELVCPDLHLRQLELCSKVINMIADGKQPDDGTLAELDVSIVK